MNPPFAENDEQIQNGTFDTGRMVYLPEIQNCY